MKVPADDGLGPAEEKIDQRRLDEIFGDVLPETTDDERGLASGFDDEWYRSNRPPHHDH